MVGEGSNRAAAALAWSIAAASLVLLLTGVTFSYLSRSIASASVDGSNWLDYWIGFGIAVVGASYLTVGALVASRRPSNAVGWVLSFVGLVTVTLTRLKLQMGAGKTTVDLTGDYARGFDASIQGGVGKATIMLPSGVGVKAKAQGGLGKIDAEGLARVGDSYVNDAMANQMLRST